MKRKLSQFLCLFMAFQVLFASTGLAVVEHLCEVKGKQIFLISNTEKCCFEKKNESKSSENQQLKKSKCCEEHTSFHKINTDSAGSNGSVLEIINTAWLAESAPFCFNHPQSHGNTIDFVANYASPPPIAGRNLLIQIQTFLI